MRKVEFFDTSLRDGEQTPGVNFSIKEKVAIAKQLEKWGISVIEAGFPAASPDSFEAVKFYCSFPLQIKTNQIFKSEAYTYPLFPCFKPSFMLK